MKTQIKEKKKDLLYNEYKIKWEEVHKKLEEIEKIQKEINILENTK